MSEELEVEIEELMSKGILYADCCCFCFHHDHVNKMHTQSVKCTLWNTITSDMAICENFRKMTLIEQSAVIAAMKAAQKHS